MSAVSIPKKPRQVFFYVDGFNLYHRCLENKPSYKWLCLRKLATDHLFPGDVISKIKYFTAEVDPRGGLSPRKKRQQAYWAALRSQKVEVIEGLMEKRDRVCKADHICDKAGVYSQYTEKMSDVNLALHIYRDFVEESPDIICVLSADLDVLPALKMVRETGKKIGKKVMIRVLLPTQDDRLYYNRVQDFGGIAITSQLSETFVKKARLNDKITAECGTVIECPSPWQETAPASA